MRSLPALLIRAHAGRQVGAGHVMRCLALAQGWRDQDAAAEVCFMIPRESSGLTSAVAAEGMRVEAASATPGGADDASQTLAQAAQMQAGWLVLDGYCFDTSYQQRIRDAGFRLLVVDDFAHAGRYVADIVLNQNLHATESLYAGRDASTRLLLGVGYALLRREFRKWSDWQRSTMADARKVVVTLGGSDPEQMTAKILQALRGLTGLEVTALVGPCNPDADRLRADAASLPFPVKIEQGADLPALMAASDSAIAAAGSTSWELAFMQLPSLLLATAENQRSVAEHLAQSRAALSLGWHSDLRPDALRENVSTLLKDADRRREMARRGRELVDGDGVVRVLAAMQEARR